MCRTVKRRNQRSQARGAEVARWQAEVPGPVQTGRQAAEVVAVAAVSAEVAVLVSEAWVQPARLEKPEERAVAAGQEASELPRAHL